MKHYVCQQHMISRYQKQCVTCWYNTLPPDKLICCWFLCVSIRKTNKLGQLSTLLPLMETGSQHKSISSLEHNQSQYQCQVLYYILNFKQQVIDTRDICSRDKSCLRTSRDFGIWLINDCVPSALCSCCFMFPYIKKTDIWIRYYTDPYIRCWADSFWSSANAQCRYEKLKEHIEPKTSKKQLSSWSIWKHIMLPRKNDTLFRFRSETNT